MESRHLRYFVTICEMGSLSKAADVLHISQPTLSQQIASMEHDLGVPLLIRSSVGVRPTEAGTRLYSHARGILREMHDLRAHVTSEGSGAIGDVAVGLPTSVAAVIAAPLVERMAQDHPGVRLQLFESYSGYLNELLANGRLDIAVLFRETETPGIAIRKLLVERLAVYGAREVGDPNSPECELPMLAGVPMVLPGSANGLRLIIERFFSRASLHLNVVADIDSLRAMLLLARNGTAATISSAAVVHSIDAPILVRRIVNPVIKRPICLCRPTSIPQSAAALAAEETIRTLIRESKKMWDVVE